jgi:hypothetical protein
MAEGKDKWLYVCHTHEKQLQYHANFLPNVIKRHEIQVYGYSQKQNSSHHNENLHTHHVERRSDRFKQMSKSMMIILD